MEHHRYEGPVFEHERPHPELGALLDRRDALVEVGAGAEASVVLGVPHHAALGVDRIAEKRLEGGRVADENAVLYALACHEMLFRAGVSARVLVAAHATDHDPNKRADSAYCRRLFEVPRLRLLIECHGASHRAPHDLELTAGRNGDAEPLRFGRLLAKSLGPGIRFAAQREPGTSAGVLLDAQGGDAGASTLRFPALRTRSLVLAASHGVAALHLEAKPRFRSRGDGTATLTLPGRRLGDSLASAAQAYLEGVTRGSG